MVRGWSVLKPAKDSLKLCKFLLPIRVASGLKQWVEESKCGNGSDAFSSWRILLGGESPTAVMQNANQCYQGQDLAFDKIWLIHVSPEVRFL